MTDGIARFRDFSGDSDPIQFKVGSEIFTALDDIPLKTINKLAEFEDQLGDGGKGNFELRLLRTFERLLEPASYETFVKAVNGEIPGAIIGVKRVRDIIPWLLEQYGLRPTVPSDSSSVTSGGSGENLTVGVPVEESTSESLNPFAV